MHGCRIMGATGAGKSTFINLFFDKTVAKTSDSLNSCTADVKDYPGPWRKDLSRRIVLVDTPGFNDSHEDEAEILRRVSVWLAKAYDDGMRVAGVIYLSDIAQKRVYGSTRLNLTMLQKLCGDDFYPRIVMATSHWDEVPLHVGEPREEQLRENFWAEIIGKGGKTWRIITRDDALAAIDSIAEEHRRRGLQTDSGTSTSSSGTTVNEDAIALLLQRELVELDKIIPATGAGKELKGNIRNLLEVLKHEVAEEQDPEKKAELQRKLQFLRSQVKQLNIPLGERLRIIFGF
ncbi:TKL/TKL-ccin protein kinase [Coprinopsis cinerea AmutBmut pab1-1]|nr:TKL/TKL-ccin protein kinase [Coprinopsis cinerea AmutBmut pab1-1]